MNNSQRMRPSISAHIAAAGFLDVQYSEYLYLNVLKPPMHYTLLLDIKYP